MNQEKESCPESIGDRIARIIVERGISQKVLAERAQVSPCAVTNIVANRRKPGIDVLARIAKVLNADCNYLIMGTSAQTVPFAKRSPPPVARIRRSAQEIARMRALDVEKMRRFGTWSKQTHDRIVLFWQALASDPFAKGAAESLLSFFVRYTLAKSPLSAYSPPEPGIPRPGMTYKANPTPEQLKKMLGMISTTKRQILCDFMRDLASALSKSRAADGGASEVESPWLKTELDPMLYRIRKLFELTYRLGLNDSRSMVSDQADPSDKRGGQ